PEEVLAGALGAHAGDLGAGQGEAGVVAERPGVKAEGAPAVSLGEHEPDAGDGGRGVGMDQLGAVADYAPPLEVLPRLEPRRVDEGEDGQVEGVAVLHEPGRLAGRLDVERARPRLGMVGDDPDRPAAEAA